MSDTTRTEPAVDRAQGQRAHVPSAPHLNLPKGGGAIRGVGEKFAANPATGAGSFSVPIPASPGRSDFGPRFSLQYDSSAGNGPFGFGWSLSLPSIHRKTDKGLPRYDDLVESDTFILAGAEDLVPLLRADGSRHADTTTDPGYTIRRYRPRVEAQFDRIERWTDNATLVTHWRILSRDNILTILGRDPLARIADSHDATRVFAWLVSEMRDDKGNAIVFDYKSEEGADVDFGQIAERNRGPAADSRRQVQRYPKSIRYGNRQSLLDAGGNRPRFVSDATRNSIDWMFEIVFDYGEHDVNTPRPDDTGIWLARHDPFSSYRSGFEVRSYRLCQRILIFHHFPQDPNVGRNCLVRSLDLEYRSTRGVPDDVQRGHPNASFVATMRQSGYVRSGAGYVKKALPPLAFEYSEAQLQEEVQEVPVESLEQLPVGLDTSTYTWVDLDGEGVSGILTEQGGNWFFKRNRGEGRFAAAQTVPRRPATATLSGTRQQLLDLDGDGRLELAQFSGAGAGFFERTSDADWEPFRPFADLPNIPWHEPNLKFVDLNGDGLADVLITEQDVFTWYPSIGADGFGPAHTVRHVSDEERAPHLLLSDGTQAIFLADMSGDGLVDLVRIRSGEACYWPNLGYGRFGAKVSMDNAPRFERMDQFDGRRLRLADLDGSGTTDLVYLGVDGVDLYFNLSGNQWSASTRLSRFPKVDDVSAVSVVDLLGKGTMCLVWSSPLPASSRSPLRYIDLMSEKPHLLTKCANNLGAETIIQYASSTRFYLDDRDHGRTWVTRLPFPVHVVERVETYDRVSRNRFVTRYSYHHGHFDGVEREFRGFGRVDQLDTEELGATSVGGTFPNASNIDEDSYVPPVQTKTWFHTGAFIDADRISRHYAVEYYREGDPSTTSGALTDAQFEASLLEDSQLSTDWSAREMREGCRALRGQMLRQEIYALDKTPAAARPYSVSERNYTLALLQGFGPNEHAAFRRHGRETIDCHYERALYPIGGNSVSDPRVTHAMVLDVDDFGNELLSASIAYGRRHDDPDPLLTAADRARQKLTLATATQSVYTNAVDLPDAYRAPLPAEVQTFELVKLGGPAATANPTPYFTFTDLHTRWSQAADGLHDLPYEDLTGSGAIQNAPYRRLIECVRHVLRADNLTALLPKGTVQSLGLPGVTYKLALTPGLLGSVYRRANGAATENLIPDPATTLGDTTADAGGYVDADGNGNWWIPSQRVFYDTAANAKTPAMTAGAELASARQHFFAPRLFVDAFWNGTQVDYDADDLLVVATRDPRQNSILARNDYRVLQPARVTEPNGNRIEAAFDALGFVAGTAVKGTTDAVGDSLTGFVSDLDAKDLSDFFADPRGESAKLLKDATTRFVYDLDRYTASGAARSPAYAATIVRERHVSDPVPGPVQTSFSYSDGFGREIQHKSQAEDGPLAPSTNDVARWATSGWTVFNNKGQPARQYEPFFDGTHGFTFGNTSGPSAVLFYDPPGRVVATLHPDDTWDKVVFDPWRQTSWDANDTVAVAVPTNDPDAGMYLSRVANVDFSTTWLSRRTGGALGADQEDAATKAAAHASTPTVACFDTLGRTFLTIADNGKDAATKAQKYVSRTELDIEGNVRVVRDALDRIVMAYDYDMLGTRIHQSSMEAAERWTINDVTGKVIRAWDSRRQMFRTAYDALRRLTETLLSDDLQTDVVISRVVYGEDAAHPEDFNRRGRIYQQFDQAGVVTNELYDFKGNLRRTVRELCVEYRKTLDWSKNPARDGDPHPTETLHDALNRPIQIEAPDHSLIRPGYNQSNHLDTVDVSLPTAPAWTSFISNIDYDPKGQRVLIAYGNGAVTHYSYDEDTFRLTRLLTTRPASGGAGATESVQDWNYAYDPVGNITFIRDDAQQPLFFRNKKVEPSSDYTYDPIYRLIRAIGREQLGQAGGQPNAPAPYGPDESFRTGLDHPGDGDMVGTYDESYTYDAVGNLLALVHAGSDPKNPGWTRAYGYHEPSLIELAKQSNRLSNTAVGAVVEQYQYTGSAGLHGDITSMPHLQVMEWDFHDQLRATARQAVNSGTPETTWYVYDSAGQRARKVTDASATAGSNPHRRYERIYLGLFEIYRAYAVDDSKEFERTTLHVMDDKQRIALVETRTSPSNGDGPALLTRYQFGNHLGSACLELDEHATTISYEEYSPYGSTSYQAVNKTIRAAAKRYRYTGMERDEESDFSYHGARYYAAWLGRWTTPDPRMADSTAYSYSMCNPIRHTDTNGLEPTEGSELRVPRSWGDSDRIKSWTAATDAQRTAAYAKAAPEERGWVQGVSIRPSALDKLSRPEHFGGIVVAGKVQVLAATSVAGVSITAVGWFLAAYGSLTAGISAGHLYTKTDITGKSLTPEELLSDKINVGLGLMAFALEGVAATRPSPKQVASGMGAARAEWYESRGIVAEKYRPAAEIQRELAATGARDNPQFNSIHDVELPKKLIGPKVSDERQFAFAKKDLRAALEAKGALAKLPPSVRDSLKQYLASPKVRPSDVGLVWHHHEDFRFLQLVYQVAHKVWHFGGRFITGGRP